MQPSITASVASRSAVPSPSASPYTSLSLTLLALSTALLGACSSAPIASPPPLASAQPASTALTSAAPARAPAPVSRQPTGVQPAAASTVSNVAVPAYLDPKSDIATGRSVYFDFDATTLKLEFSGLIERHGQFLLANPKVVVKIEGHTDERGSAEYNLALGQKRAEAVRQSLKVYGVKDTQLEAISWGREKPKATGHDESAWAQNRRADVQYPSR